MGARSACLALVVLGVLPWLGCEQDNPLGRQAIQGTVTLNGDPIKTGTVMFLPTDGGPTISGAAITEGQFEITTQKGLTPGTYAVKINAPDFSLARTPAPGPHEPPPSLIPAEWSDGKTHTITVTAEGSNAFTFDIKK